jgi:alpha-tubulin suppressor-like RCC1 family protein
MFTGIRVTLTVIASLSATGCYHSITAGSAHVCVLKGTVPYCVGQNTVGQFGNPTSNVYATQLTRAAGGMHLDTISAGDDNTCGTAKGKAFCWGENQYAQVGDPAKTECYYAAPQQVQSDRPFVKVATGDTGSCALTPRGEMYCWGDNGNGQIGQGNTTTGDSCPNAQGRPCYLSPTLVKGGLTFASINAHQSTRCGVTEDGKLYCWGNPEFRQVGIPDGSNYPSAPVQIEPNWSRVAIAAHASCGIDKDGKPYCWGISELGVLGAAPAKPECDLTSPSNPACSPTPTPVDGNLHLEGHTLGAQDFTVCALDRRGTAWCWGDNSQGQLGKGTVGGYSMKAAPVAGSLRFREIATGGDKVCAIDRSGRRVYCWGYNFDSKPQLLK